jgi:3-oxoacyl-[acyl-carrier protein] reductase
LTRTMAWEWADAGVRVNCLEPGAVLTPASRFASEETERKVTQYIAVERVGRPEDIARVCLFLSSEGTAYLTGETIRVAGGPHTSTPADIGLLREVVS